MTRYRDILVQVSDYYSEKLEKHGQSPQGVDWNGKQSQELRFKILSGLWSDGKSFSVNEIGCGYGALYDYLEKQGTAFTYFGSDLSATMVSAAKSRYANRTGCHFYRRNSQLPVSDYTVCSGLFNVKLNHDRDTWQEYVLSILKKMDKLSNKGFAFNMLTKYSDKERMQEKLYYADPSFFFDYCKVHFARNVALLHDYGLYEFTILVRKVIPK